MRAEAMITELGPRIDRVNRLLADPHPGLMTWCVALADEMDGLTRFWNTPAPELAPAPVDRGSPP